MTKSRQLDWTGQSLFVGVDVHLRSWTVCILTETVEHKTFRQPPDAAVLGDYLQRYFPGAAVQVVYEAGFCGFAVQRALAAAGIRCLVVHPGDVPTTDKARRRKTDRADARKLAHALRAGQLTPIYVPPPWAEADRGLIRYRATLVKERTRCKNRIKSLLRLWNVPVPAGCQASQWSAAGLARLAALPAAHPALAPVLPHALTQYETLQTHLQTVTRQIRALAATPRYQARVALLRSIPGIGVLSAMTWLTELVTVDRFPTFGHLCSYVGLVPGEHSSGETTRPTGLDRRGNPHLRRLLIENSWVALRADPALLQAYQRWSHRMAAQQAILRVARKLLRRLRRVLRTQEPYTIGVVE